MQKYSGRVDYLFFGATKHHGLSGDRKLAAFPSSAVPGETEGIKKGGDAVH
jgi:hypothetical protein